MTGQLRRTARYVRSWVTGPADLVEEERTLDRDGISIPATLLRPRRRSAPLPGWVILHGITRPGRAHAQLVRFTRTLASTGAAVVVPDVPEWRALDLAPRLAVPTVRCAIDELRAEPEVVDEPYGLIGFSFGAPHTLAAAAHDRVRDDVAGAVGFGGYCDLARTVVFMMTGRHEHGGTEHHLRPDPYGRWIVAANYLTAVAGFEDAGAVAEALLGLAKLAGDVGAPAWDACYDEAKAELRTSLDDRWHDVFDLFAPESGAEPDPVAGEAIGRELAVAARVVEPEIEPFRALGESRGSMHVLHGRKDHLIPFTEGLRIREALSDRAPSYATVTRLFGHSAQDSFPSPLRAAREVPVFLRALTRMLAIV